MLLTHYCIFEAKVRLFFEKCKSEGKKINMMENIGGNKAKGLVFYCCFDRT